MAERSQVGFFHDGAAARLDGDRWRNIATGEESQRIAYTLSADCDPSLPLHAPPGRHGMHTARLVSYCIKMTSMFFVWRRWPSTLSAQTSKREDVVMAARNIRMSATPRCPAGSAERQTPLEQR
jgi:hypothetical protein